MSTITLLSPAKINLTLDILGTRTDGYHELRSIMQPIDFFDEVTIVAEQGEGIKVKSSGVKIPEDNTNLAWKAAESYLQESGLKLKVDITIKKRIPPGAGLGGGSGNAASVLVGLNKLTRTLPDKELFRIAGSIGADVPFFIRSQTALAEGIGEKITVLKKFPLFYYLILCPNLHVSTQDVFKKWDELNPEPGIKDQNSEVMDTDNLGSLFKESVLPPLRNGLEEAAFNLYPEINSYKKILSSMGAQSVLMSGSGSSVFALYKKEREAEEAYDYLKTSPTFTSVLAQGIRGWHFVI